MNSQQKTENKTFRQLTAYCLLLTAVLPLLWNLLRPGFYTSHDGEWMVIRLTAFHQALREGQLPVRWLPRLNHGYGYPVANFLYPLPFYAAEPFYVLTGDPATAVQIVMGLSIMAMATGMYIFLFSLITNHPARLAQQSVAGGQSLIAAIGALTYVYSPYVAYNLYQRGSLGELVAMGIVPWVFWAVRRGQLLLGSIALSSLILSHNVVAILFFPLILVFMSSKILKRKRYLRLSLTTYYLLLTTFALGLSAFFWLPALAELRFVRASTIAVSDFQNEYLSMTEAFRRSGPLVTVANLGLPLYFFTDSSKEFWEALKPLQVVQFPWRLLSVFSFTGAVISATFLSRLESRKVAAAIVSVLIIVISFQYSWKFLRPSSFVLHPSTYYSTNDDTTTVRAEYTPIWVKDLPKERPSEPAIHYYPGWRAFVDGKEAMIADPNTTNGILKTVDPVDSSRVRFLWSETPLRAFSNLISIASMVGLLYWEHRRQEEQERHQRDRIRASA